MSEERLVMMIYDSKVESLRRVTPQEIDRAMNGQLKGRGDSDVDIREWLLSMYTGTIFCWIIELLIYILASTDN